MRPVTLILGCCAALLVACGGSKDASKPSASATAAIAVRKPGSSLSALARAEVGYLLARLARRDARAKGLA